MIIHFLIFHLFTFMKRVQRYEKKSVLMLTFSLFYLFTLKKRFCGAGVGGPDADSP